jgi:predicted nucleic acid-binding protein
MDQSPVPTLVIDASVAIKWYLDDEDFVDVARSVLYDAAARRIRLRVPGHFHFEVANALRAAVQSKRIEHEPGYRSINNLLRLPISSASDPNLILNAYQFAQRFDCTLYDAAYVALADATQSPLVYADRKLQVSLAGRFPHARWIARYPSLI